MVFILLYASVFFMLACLSFFDDKKTKAVKWVYVSFVVILVLMAAFRPIGVDKDALNYVYYYNNTNNLDYFVEPTFLFISNVASAVFDGPQFIFVAYALLSIPLKAYALVRLTKFWFITLLVWMSYYLILQDMTQIRAAAAIAFFIYGLWFLQRGERMKYVLLIIAGSFFHISALVLLPLALMGNRSLSKRWLWVLYVTPLVGFVLAGLKMNLLTLIPIPYVQERFELYENAKDMGVFQMDEFTIFNPVYMIRMLIYYVLLWKQKYITSHVDNFPLLIKIFCISLICYALFSFLPVMSYRMRELFGVVEILLVPYIAHAIRPYNLGRLLVVLYAIAVFLLNIFYSKLLNFTY